MSDLQKELIQLEKQIPISSKQTKKYIRESLKGFIEINPEELEIESLVSYIYIKNGRLRLGGSGYVVVTGDKLISFKRGDIFWKIPTKYYNKKDQVIFTTRFFRRVDRLDNLDKRTDKMEKVLTVFIKKFKKMEKEFKIIKNQLDEEEDSTYSDGSYSD